MDDIFIDFDRTLFDTDRLYLDLDDLCISNGINNDVLACCKKNYISNNKSFDYFQIVKNASQICALNYHTLFHLINSYMDETASTYIFYDTTTFLEKLYSSKIRVHILTYGNVNFQTWKIKKSRIYHKIPYTIITDYYKWLYPKFPNSFIAIDDNPREICNFKLKYPHCTICELKRNGTKYASRYSGVADFVWTELGEIQFENLLKTVE